MGVLMNAWAPIMGWGFGAFLYFKVAFDGAFNDNLTLTGALVSGIIFGISIFSATGIYAWQLLPYNALPVVAPVRVGKIVAKSLFAFLGATFVYLIVLRLVIFGFSKELSDEIEFYIEEEFFYFLILATVPMLAHYATVVAGTWLKANASLPSADSDDLNEVLDHANRLRIIGPLPIRWLFLLFLAIVVWVGVMLLAASSA